MGTPQELTGDCGNVVWCNYEFAWGGRYTHHYTSQSLNDCAIIESDLQPIKFQGQFFDTETSLHYNRFRYYDSDVGMFIQRDPIGLLGGYNVFQYAPNPIGWVDPWGLSKWTKNSVLGRTVYQNDNLFNPNRKSSWIDSATGKSIYGTNVQRMASGYAPIGKDGKPVQLHHLTQTELNANGSRGSVAEILNTSHNKYSSVLHFPTPMRNPNNRKQTIPRYPSFRKDNSGNRTILADEFDNFRENYWRERSKDFCK